MLPTLLLSAGLGTRLDPLTRLVAKPAVPLGDHTLIELVVAWLTRQRVRDIVINLHSLPASIATVVGDGQHLGVSARYSWEQPLLGSAGGPRRALPLLAADTFLIVNGDTLCDVELAPMLDAHRTTGADATLAVIPNPAPNHYNGVLVDDDGVVTGFVPKGHTVPSWHFVGIQIVQRQLFAPLEDGVPSETVAGIYRERLASQPGCLRAWRLDVPFLDVGTPRDYLSAALRESGGVSGRARVAPSAHVTRCAIWPDVVIHDNVVLEDCVLAGPIVIPEGFESTTAVIVPASYARPDDRVRIDGDLAIFPLDVAHR